MNEAQTLAPRNRRSGVHHGWAILSAVNLILLVALACSSTAKVETASLCDALSASLPADAPCPPVPVGGFDQLAELVRYPKWFKQGDGNGQIPYHL